MRLPRSVWRAVARALFVVALASPLAACDFLTGVPSVDRVTLTVPATALSPGQQMPATGVAFNDNGNVITHSRRQVTYASSDENILRVNAQSGLITAVAVGVAEVRASAGGRSTAVEITVRPLPIRQVVIGQSDPVVRLAPGVTRVLSAALLDTANLITNARTPSWRSLDTNVAIISQAGLVTPRALGTTSIIASVDTGLAPRAGLVADTVVLRVTPTPIKAVRIAPEQPVIYTGQTLRFTATVIDSLDRQVTDRVVIWRTSDRGLNVTIDSLTGAATGVTPSGFGTTVTATVETVPTTPGFPAPSQVVTSITAQVLAPVASIRVTGPGGAAVSTLSLPVNGTTTLGFTPLDARGTGLANRIVIPVSADPAIASIDRATGQVTARAAGTTTLTVQGFDAAGTTPQGSAAIVTITVTP